MHAVFACSAAALSQLQRQVDERSSRAQAAEERAAGLELQNQALARDLQSAEEKLRM